MIRVPMSQLVHRFTALAVAILWLGFSANGQGVGSSRGLSSGDGANTIQGRVYFPAGEQARPLKVILESNDSVGGSSTVTDQDGVFRFNSVRAGNYAVLIDGGKDYEAAREPVTIDPIGRGRIVQINIQLHPKVSASNPAFTGVPQSALDFYQKGAAAAQKGNSKEAAQFLDKAVTAYPNFALALNELGVQYMKLLQWDKAADTFETLLKQRPNDATAHLDLGIALYNLSSTLLADKKMDAASEKLSSAESHLREAVKLNSASASAHYYLGMTLIKLRRYDEAQVELESAIKNGGDGIALAHRYLGGLYQSAHKNKEAADELEKYLKLDPKVKDADTIRGIIQKLRQQ